MPGGNGHRVSHDVPERRCWAAPGTTRHWRPGPSATSEPWRPTTEPWRPAATEPKAAATCPTCMTCRYPGPIGKRAPCRRHPLLRVVATVVVVVVVVVVVFGRTCVAGAAAPGQPQLLLQEAVQDRLRVGAARLALHCALTLHGIQRGTRGAVQSWQRHWPAVGVRVATRDAQWRGKPPRPQTPLWQRAIPQQSRL